MKYYALFLAAIATSSSEAFSVSSRKAFLSNAATAAIVATPFSANAADGVAQRILKKKQAETKARKAAESGGESASFGSDADGPSNAKGGSNASFRGGKQEADKIALGTELNKAQSDVASGLMDKMGGQW
mmetsp:Transcript_34393/g.83185  ORF Transcript_34393/g.83185 Transcript_34393/m.83185 type:complete len:130 (-) Transcript_34393:1665-2054(-)